MNIELIISIVTSVLAIVGAAVSYYFYIRSLISTHAVDAVNVAEESDAVAQEKLQIAVDHIYKLLPVSAKTFIPRSLVELIVQKAFDGIEQFAKRQNNKE